jgi:5'-3' exonuclease
MLLPRCETGMTRVHLIDASPYLFRAFFSLPKSITGSDGKPVNAAYGFAQFLSKYIEDEKPTHIAVAFDRHFNHSFRNEYYAAYKAQRDASPPELDAQVDLSVAVASCLGMATFIDERYEADDLIATIVHQTRAARAEYVIVTSDKDMTQLVNERVIVVDPARKLRFDAAAVEEKFGVRPDQIIDFLALAGDSVDNIPGVRGIGPKTAAELLRRYGSLEGIYENIAAMRQSRKRSDLTLAAKLTEDVELAGLSKRLATVAIDAPIKVKLDDLRYQPSGETGSLLARIRKGAV